MSNKTKISFNGNGELETSIKGIEMMDEKTVIVPFNQLIKLKVEDFQGIEEIAVPNASVTKKPEFSGFRKYEELSISLTPEKNGKVEVSCAIFPPNDMENYGLGSIYQFQLQKYFKAEKKVNIWEPALSSFVEIQREYEEHLKSDPDGLHFSCMHDFVGIKYIASGKTFQQLITELHKLLMQIDKKIRLEMFN